MRRSKHTFQNFSGYVFGVGIHKSVVEAFDHALDGNLFYGTENQKTIFITRNLLASSYKNCPAFDSIESYEADICLVTQRGRNLHGVVAWIRQQCPDLVAVAVIRYNTNYQGHLNTNGMKNKGVVFKQKCLIGFSLTVVLRPN